MARPFSEKIIAELPTPARGNRREYFSGSQLQGKRAPSGFHVTVTASGCKSFGWFHRHNGQPYTESFGRWVGSPKGGTLTALNALILAAKRAAEVTMGAADPRPGRTRRLEDRGKRRQDETCGDLFAEYIAIHVKTLRTANHVRGIFKRVLIPQLGRIPLRELRRVDIVNMLDGVREGSGPIAAKRAQSWIRGCLNWREERDDTFKSPLPKGVLKIKEHARERVLTDDEINRLWTATEGDDAFHQIVRMLLLTGARRLEVAHLPWAEIEGNLWHLPALRHKNGNNLTRPLSEAVLAILDARPRVGPYVFATGEKPPTSLSRPKVRLDKASGVTDWTLHDLRRTVRSLMSRAGVPADHAERAIGHVISGVRGVYDRHRYEEEMLRAFEALASLIARIVNATEADVVQLRRGG
jgi:integrase